MRIIHNFRRMDTSGMARKEKGKGKLTKSVMFLFYLKRESWNKYEKNVNIY